LLKEIWLGPVLGSNRERLLARCAEYVSQGETDRLLYIAASHPLLDLAAARVLDGKSVRGVWGEFPFYLFRGFVRRVLTSAVSEARPLFRATPGGDPLLTRLPTQPLQPRVPIDREELPLRRSLISQIIKQLADAGRLEAIKPLANRDGCVNTIASTIGELQRAGTTPDEFRAAVEARAGESQVSTLKSNAASRHSQIDFDREVALVYSKYTEALDRFGLTDDDADQLRALQILRGELNGEDISLPWLNQIDLLVLDGFFDFTPVQGQMLRQLIPTVPNVIVNVNYDQENEQIFRPFQSTIEQLKAISDFEEPRSDNIVGVNSQLMALRQRLFNPSELGGNSPTIREGSAAGKMPAVRPQDAGAPMTLLECSDRETEIRSIIKETKRLIVEADYQLSEIALVVRERAAYAETILRVCAAESIPCNLERRIEANQIPCMRACAKLFQILREHAREHVINPKATELAHLVKTDYFRVSREDLQILSDHFDEQYAVVFDVDSADETKSKLRYALGIGQWVPDTIENVIAYVGSELRVRSWLNRAQNLINVLPSPEAARSFIGEGENGEGDDAAAIAEQEPPPEDAPQEKTKRPSPVHPATIAWTMLVIDHLRQTIAITPEEGTPDELRAAIMLLLERLEFSKQVSRPLGQAPFSIDIPQATLDVRGMESIRRALAATVRSFQMSESVVSEARPRGPQPGSPAGVGVSEASDNELLLTRGLLTHVSLSSFVDELERCVQSQVLSISTGDHDGLRVLEATDVRGLRFRAMFIAGMVEGGFPLRASSDWLYPHEERERLKKYGVVLEDISTDTLLKEEHYFYQCACRATERLYLTRPLAAGDGNETVPSYYIEELRRAISPAELEKKQIRGDVDDHDLKLTSTVTELGVELIRQKARQSHRSRIENLLPAPVAAELLSQAHREGYVSDSVLRRVEIELQRAGDSFGPYDGRITNRDLQSILENHFGNDHVYSASGLSAYGNCPFRFFAARVLKLEPRNEAALDLPAIDAGKLLHDVLRRFFERHRKEYLPALDREALRKEIVAVADKVFREHELLVPPLNERIWKIDCEIRKLILEQVLLFELRLQERTCARGMQPTYFELAFGRASQASDPSSSDRYLKLERSGAGSSEAALIQGQIDRVDVSEDGKRAIAYDYKLSQGAKLNDMESGRQVQIPIYLAALEQLFVPGFELAGGGYYRLRGRGARLNQGLYRKMFEDCTEVTNHRVKLDEVEWQRIRRAVNKRVWQFIDGMRSGDFRVLPSLGKVTCKFCDFSAVCRYDTYRIGRKKMNH
jgi:ATP-dependent helicase/DNAse subunit B